MTKNGNEILNMIALLKRLPTFRDLGKSQPFKTSTKTETPLPPSSRTNRNTQKPSTFCDTLSAVPSVASNAAAAEACGEVPAFRVHRALVSVVGTRLAGIRVVAEYCLGKTRHTG